MLLTEFNEKRNKKVIFKNKGFISFILFYMLIAILQSIIRNAVAWSTYGGPGFGELEITHTGEIALMGIYLIPYPLGFGVFIDKMISLYRKKEKLRTYLLYVPACTSGIVLGIIIFWLDTYTIRFSWIFVDVLILIIRAVRWVDYPIP